MAESINFDYRSPTSRAPRGLQFFFLREMSCCRTMRDDRLLSSHHEISQAFFSGLSTGRSEPIDPSWSRYQRESNLVHDGAGNWNRETRTRTRLPSVSGRSIGALASRRDDHKSSANFHVIPIITIRTHLPSLINSSPRDFPSASLRRSLPCLAVIYLMIR